MHALFVKAVPTRAFRVLAVTLAILLAVVFENVVLAGTKNTFFVDAD